MSKKFDVFAFNKALADGPYTCPGGYPVFFVCEDGDILSFKAAEDNAHFIRDDIVSGFGCWNLIGVAINWEDGFLFCSHTGEQIQSAYGE